MKPRGLGQAASTSHGSSPLCKVSLPVLGSCTSPKKSTFPHRSQQHIWRFSSKTCWAGRTQAITEISDSLCISPSLDIVELQLLLLCRTHAELSSLTFLQRSPHSSSLQSLFHGVFQWECRSPPAATSCLPNPIGDTFDLGPACCLHSPKCHP